MTATRPSISHRRRIPWTWILACVVSSVACADSDDLVSDDLADVGTSASAPDDAGRLDAGPPAASPPDAGVAETGADDADGVGVGAVWNPDTCLVDDDGASRGPGNLEVSSMVLAEDSDPGDRIDDGTTVYFPTSLQTSACRFKVIGWGNGSTGSGGADYPAYFEHLASYGFVVAVAHTNATLAESAPILTAVDLVRAQNNDRSSIFFDKLDPSFGLMGKSQGAIALARDLSHPDAVAGVLIGSGSRPDSSLSKPGLFATGDADFARQFVVQAFEAATAAAVFAQAVQGPNPQGDPSAGHMDLNDRRGIVELATSFMRCHLRGNERACSHVACESCQTEAWSAFETKNLP